MLPLTDREMICGAVVSVEELPLLPEEAMATTPPPTATVPSAPSAIICAVERPVSVSAVEMGVSKFSLTADKSVALMDELEASLTISVLCA